MLLTKIKQFLCKFWSVYTQRSNLKEIKRSGNTWAMMALELSTADVYEQASLIGQDIDWIIERYGHDSVVDFMPKVIRVLESLEVLVREREKENLEIAELKLENERLYVEIKKEANNRRRLDEVCRNLFTN